MLKPALIGIAIQTNCLGDFFQFILPYQRLPFCQCGEDSPDFQFPDFTA